GDRSIKELKEAFSQNPLLFLSEKFETIQKNVNAAEQALTDVQTKISSPGVFDNSPKADVYQTAIKEQSNGLADMQGLIFGSGDIGAACRDLKPVLDLENATAIEAKKTECAGRLIDLLIDNIVNYRCGLLNRAQITDAGQFVAERASIDNQRKNIAQENCSYGSVSGVKNPPIACPTHFCLDPSDPTHWGATNDALDPICAKETGKTGPDGQDTDGNGLVLFNHIVWDTTDYPEVGSRQWPPQTRCLDSQAGLLQGYAQKYQGAQQLCIATQARAGALDDLKVELEKIDVDPNKALQILQTKCSELEKQRSIKADCENFELVEKALQNKCIGVGKCSGCEDPQCSEDGICKCGNDIDTGSQTAFACFRQMGNYYCRECCEAIRARAAQGLCKKTENGIERGVLGCRGNPFALLPSLKNGFGAYWDNLAKWAKGEYVPDLTNEDNSEDLVKVKDACENRVQDLKTSLDGVMKVYSILMGIKSAYGIYQGIENIQTSYFGVMEQIDGFVRSLQNAQEDISRIWNEDNAGWQETTGGFDVKPLACVSHPAVSYNNNQKLTGPAGGPVCPAVDGLYLNLQDKFTSVRQAVLQLDLSRKTTKTQYLQSIAGIDLPFSVKLWQKQAVRYHDIDPLYDKATRIRWQSSFVWALATMVDFASQNCTCGESWCKMPLCISGIPLTLAPMKNANCYLTWIMRYPMMAVADKLGEDLEEYYK
ncbi:MAG: hypothetical protein M1127_00990, partial [Patescibacteria group bacterium]|nr:hypothetical protein [Patescibacteria group bacterium]